LKLALEALETELAVDMTNGAEVGEAAELMFEAITAIKQALAAQPAPVQEPVAETLQQQLEKAEAALYSADADIRRIKQLILRQL